MTSAVVVVRSKSPLIVTAILRRKTKQRNKQTKTTTTDYELSVNNNNVHFYGA